MRIPGADWQSPARQPPDRRATGRNAASVKYDILSALGAHGCAGDKHLQRLALRLITLIVARYNWITDELAVGQRDIAVLWSVDERSVKREMGRMKGLGWLVLKRPAARGRVAVHGLDLAAILAQTAADWPRIGSDFVARMSRPEGGEGVEAPASNVITFPAPAGEGGLWSGLQARLYREDPNLYGAWFAALRAEPPADGMLTLIAPSRFHADYLTANYIPRLERLAAGADPAIRRVTVVWRP